MKKKIAIIGANDFQNQLILCAKRMGYETHVFAWECGDVGEKTADHFYPISIVEKEQILETCRQIRPDGVASIASDLASITVNYVAEKLGLPCNGIESSLLATNKHLMRQAFAAQGLPSPKSVQVGTDGQVDLTGFTYPLIVKPTDRSGSRGIFKITDPAQLPQAIAAAREQSFEDKALVEEFAEGREYSIEYLSWEGEHHFLACTKKYTTGAPHFIETGHIQPAYDLSDETVGEIQKLVPRILDTLGVRYGASHTELKVDDAGRIRIIETGARMGGDCIGSDLVYISTGYDFCKMVVQTACGEKPSLQREHPGKIAAVRFIFTQADLDNLEWVKRCHGEALYRVSDIAPFDAHEIGDSSSRYGYYLLAMKDWEEAKAIMERING